MALKVPGEQWRKAGQQWQKGRPWRQTVPNAARTYFNNQVHGHERPVVEAAMVLRGCAPCTPQTKTCMVRCLLNLPPWCHQEVRLIRRRLALSPFDLRMVAARITLLCASLYGASAWMLAVPGSRARQGAAVSRLPVAPQMSNDGLSAEFQARAAACAWATRVLGTG